MFDGLPYVELLLKNQSPDERHFEIRGALSQFDALRAIDWANLRLTREPDKVPLAVHVWPVYWAVETWRMKVKFGAPELPPRMRVDVSTGRLLIRSSPPDEHGFVQHFIAIDGKEIEKAVSVSLEIPPIDEGVPMATVTFMP